MTSIPTARGPRRRPRTTGEVPVSRPSATPVTRDVAEAVAEQRQPALHQVGADGRCGQAGDDGRDQGRTHERQQEQLDHPGPPGGCRSGSRRAGCGRGAPRAGGGAARAACSDSGAPSCDDAAVREHHRAVDQRGQRAELVGDEHDVAPRSFSTARASGAAPPGWAGRRPRSGSSRKNASGSPASARAISTRCCCPPERVATLSALAIGEADDLERVVDRAPVGPRERGEQPAATEPTGRDDLAHRGGHAGRGAGALRDEADAVPLTEPGERGAEELDRPGGDRPERR